MTMPEHIDLGLFAPPPVSQPGLALLKKGVYLFQCPVCQNLFRYDDPYEPMCTGPGALDQHEPTVMVCREIVRPSVRVKE